MNKTLTDYELDCIRFYMGDFEIVNRGDFRGGPKAYNTINALLHEGIQNEVDKIRDGKPVEVLDSEHLRQYVALIVTIYQAMQRYCCISGESEKAKAYLTTYRVDRFSEVKPLMEKKRLEGFYSTCKYGYLPEYARTKSDIVLFEIERDVKVPYLDFEDLFGKYYAKPEEAEILLPFDARVKTMEEMPLSETEKELYRDINGKSPLGKYKIFVEGSSLFLCEHFTESGEINSELSHILGDKDIEAIAGVNIIIHVQKCLAELKKCGCLNSEDAAFYVEWKRKVKHYIEQCLRR